MKKRLVWIAVTMALMLVCLGAAAEIDSGSCGTDVTWSLSDSYVLTISGNGPMEDFGSNQNLPPWNYYKNRITETVIEEGVTYIGSYAFYEYPNMTTITIPTSVYGCATYVFGDSSGLQTIQYAGSAEEFESVLYYFADMYEPNGNGAAESAEVVEYYGVPDTASGSCGDGVVWQIENGQLTISGSGRMADYDNYSSRGPWYTMRTKFTSVVIADGVTYVGNYAFYDLDNLASVTMADSVTGMGQWAFGSCSALNEAVLSAKLTEISEYAFYYCTNLTNVGLPATLNAIGQYAFYQCGMTAVDLPETLSVIGKNAFYYCSRLTEAVLPEQLTAIGESAFYGCKQLNEVRIPGTVTMVGSSAFQNCTGLTELTIGSGLTRLNDYAFSGCTGLTSIVIPGNVTELGNYVFSGCTGLTSLRLPDGLTAMGNGVFNGCPSLTSLQLADDNPYFSTVDGLLYDGDRKTLLYCPVGKDSVSLPDGLETIGASAFSGCSLLTEIQIPATVTSIGASAFSGCTGLQEIVIPEGITRIEGYTFRGCSGLNSVTLPQNLEMIGYYAFGECTALTEIDLPRSATTIEGSAFSRCSSLSSINIPKGTETISDYLFYMCDSLRSIVVPEGVRTIESGAFESCGLKTVYLPGSLSDLDNSAFSGCELETVYFGGSESQWENLTYVDWDMGEENELDGVNVIYNYVVEEEPVASGGCGENLTWKLYEDGTFVVSGSGQMDAYSSDARAPWDEYRDDIAYVRIEDGAESIGAYAFADCGNLEGIEIPASVSSIGANAFSGCTSLGSVIYSGSAGAWIRALQTEGNEALENIAIQTESELNVQLSISLEEQSVPANGYQYGPGEEILTDIVVTNEGDIDYTNVKLIDADTEEQIDFIDLVEMGGEWHVPFVHVLTEEEVLNGGYRLAVYVVADVIPDPAHPHEFKQPEGSAEVSYPIQAPDVRMEAEIWTEVEVPEGGYAAGDEIVYHLKATNTGNLTIQDVWMEGNVCGGYGEGSLEPGGTLEQTSIYTVTPEDMATDQLTNTMTVTGVSPVSGEQEAMAEAGVTVPVRLRRAVVIITGKSMTVTYNGTEQVLSGYTVEIDDSGYTENDFVFNGDDNVSGTDVGTYDQQMNPWDFENTNEGFPEVEFVVTNGTLTILPASATVTITGHSDTVAFDGEEHSVEEYSFAIDTELYTEDDFRYLEYRVGKGILPGTYAMGLRAEDFENTNGNFDNVTFDVTDGLLTIDAPVALPLDSTTDAETTTDRLTYFTFVPPETWAYCFRSLAAEADTWGAVYEGKDGALRQLASDDESGENGNFLIRTILTEGKTYYLGAKFYHGDAGSFPIEIVRDTQGLVAEADGDTGITIDYGQTAEMAVKAYSEAGEISYQWEKLDGIWEDLEGETGNRLSAAPTEYTEYACSVTDGVGTVRVFFWVDVNDTLEVEIAGEEHNHIAPHQDVQMSVRAASNSAVSYQWKIRRVNESGFNWYETIEGADASAYTAENVTEDSEYVCTVTNETGLEQSVSIYIYIDSDITAEAVGETTVNVGRGEAATLQVQAVSAAELSYQWYEYVNIYGYVPIEGANEDIYVIEDVQESRSYYCRIFNDYGKETSVSFNVKMTGDFDPHIVLSSATGGTSSLVEPGDTVTMTAWGGTGNRTYQWYGPASELTDPLIPIEGATGQVYTAGPIEHAGYYFCKITTESGLERICHEVINVENNFKLNDRSFNVGTVYEYYYGYMDETVELTVSASAYSGGFTYQWYKGMDYDLETGKALKIEGATQSSYTVTEKENYVHYFCQVRDVYGNKGKVLWTVQLSNRSDLEVELDGSWDVSAQVGETVTVGVNATSSAEISYQWYMEDGQGLHLINGANESHYSIENIQEKVNLRCTVKDTNGGGRNLDFTVTVLSSITANRVGESSRTIKPNGSETLEVEASCPVGELSYQWEKEVFDKYGNSTMRIIEGANEASYTVQHPRDGRGEYRCIITNEYNGIETVQFWVNLDNELRVYTDAETEETYKVVYISAGEPLTLQPAVTGWDLSGVTYQWLVSLYDAENDSWSEYTVMEGETENTLTVAEPVRAKYDCEVRDPYDGNQYVTYDVHVENHLTAWIGEDPEQWEITIVAAPGETVTLNAHAEADVTDGIRYSWRSSSYDFFARTWSEQELIEGAADTQLVIEEADSWTDYYFTAADKFGNIAEVSFAVQIDDGLQANVMGPVDLYLEAGMERELAVEAVNNSGEPIFYQWYRDGEPIEGATAASLTVTEDGNSEANYVCRVYNKFDEIECGVRVYLIPAVADMEALNPGTVVTAEMTDGQAYFRFVPEETGEYRFWSNVEDDTWAEVYHAQAFLVSDDDSGKDLNFEINSRLEAGETYVFMVRFFNSRPEGSFQVQLARTDVTPEFTSVLTLPAGLEVIESEAFVGLPNVEAVRIPADVTEIADDAFDENIVILGTPESEAQRWAEQHGCLFYPVD